MKSIALLFFLSISFIVFLVSCNKEYEKKEIEIQCEFLDDVSPVRSILSVNEKLHWSQWIISDTSEYYPNLNNSIEHVFHYHKKYTIEIEASAQKTGDKYYGKLDVQTPPLANRFIVKGFLLDTSIFNNINEDSLKILFNYFDSYTYTPIYRVISKKAFEGNDTVFFDEPIVYDITGFDKVEYNLANRFYFQIVTKSESLTYFQKMFYLNERYYQDRVYESSTLLYFNNEIEAVIKSLVLIVDWTNN